MGAVPSIGQGDLPQGRQGWQGGRKIGVCAKGCVDRIGVRMDLVKDGEIKLWIVHGHELVHVRMIQDPLMAQKRLDRSNHTTGQLDRSIHSI